jgi:uncharacterized membrane protein (Fun14 family)
MNLFNFSSRTAIEIVVILFTMTVCTLLLLATVGVITIKMMNPAADLKGAEGAVGNILTTVVGTLLGLIAGRAAGKLEANGQR